MGVFGISDGVFGISDGVFGICCRPGVAGRASEEGGWFPRRQPEPELSLLTGWLALPCYTNPPSFDPFSLFAFKIGILISLRHSQLVPISIFLTSRQEIPRGGRFMVDCAVLHLLLSTLEIPVHEGSSSCHQ